MTMTFKETVAPESNGEIASAEVVHVDKNQNAEVISDDVTVEKGEITEASFTSDTFSPFGVKYTVDYTYDGYEYSMEGGSEIYLSELFRELGIEAEASKAASIEFTRDGLLSITQTAVLATYHLDLRSQRMKTSAVQHHLPYLIHW